MQTQSRGRVLCIEASAPGASAGRSLAEAGFEIRSASKLSEALEIARTAPFDVLLLDLEVPQLDGPTLTRRLRERGSAAVVVWLTSQYTNALAAQAAEVGVLQLLEKPADTKALERVVSVAVDHSRQFLTMLRTLVSPTKRPRSVSATDAKNEFGAVLDSAVRDGAVVITKHDSPKAVLVSVDRVGALLARHEPDLRVLTREFDEKVARMRAPKARAAARELFAATPEELGEAALQGVKKRHA